ATYAGKARAEATKKAYRTDWAEFTAWAHHKGLATLPAEPLTVICYIVELAGAAKTSTIARRLVSIGEYHRAARCPSPADDVELQAVWAGIRHEHGTAPDVAEPISVVLLRAMIARLPPTARGKRDQALLLVGFAAALRRSELVALDRADIAERREGLVVNVRRSKTDQEGAGRRVGVPYGSTPATCPVRALEAWCQAARIEEGPLFVTFDRRGRITPNRLHPSAVNRVVQRSVAATGVSPAGYSAHSLRAGLATAAAAAGVSERAIMVQTGHRSLTVARGYIREGSLFRENAAAAVGL
ncbi:MAG: site-specific integrase, partial [Acidimicrobiales bacterium]|nr:site-specific integrase [Acidimicrobiales bacterium]